MTMRQRTQIEYSLLAILAAGMTLSAAWPSALPVSEAEHEDGKHSETPLTAQQIQDLVVRAIENQRHNDLVLDQYARTEHSVFHGTGKDSERDVVSRVIPAGQGIIRVELERDGKTSDAAYLEEQWHGAAQALVAQAHGREPHVANFYETMRHRRERADMVTAIAKAFIFRWAGRVSMNGRTLVKLDFSPDPTYRSSARFAPLYAHSRGTAWVDESSAQLVRAEADLTEDVSWGAGIIAKLYRGGQFTFEQREIAPSVWMPAHYSYDFDGRKFLFSLSVHEQMDYTDFMRVGPPEEAIAVIRREHPSIFANQNQ
jgi:quinol monooxygenase YgiN